jgi:uncharacterized protein YodC (DUF2158 family)
MQTNNAHEYTDEQLQAAIDASKSATAKLWGARSNEELASIRIAGARAFLAALPKPEAMTADEGDPYARLKAYAAAGARIRYIKMDWRVHFDWDWRSPAHCFEVHPDDLHLCPEYAPKPAPWTLPAETSAEPEQAAPADDGPPWIPHDGGPYPLRDEEVEEWEWRMRNGEAHHGTWRPSWLRWTHKGFSDDIIAFRVWRWKPGHGPQAASKADEPAQAEAKQPDYTITATPGVTVHVPAGQTAEVQPTHEELLAEAMKHPGVADVERIYGGAQPWTPQPGDVVRLKSGGPEMTVLYLKDGDKVKITWFDGRAPFEAIFPAISLTPAN